MQTNVHLPQLELVMESAAVTTVRVNVGDHVKAAQPLIEVESEKAVLEVPSPVPGYVRKILVRPGDQIGANALLCILTDEANEPIEQTLGSQAPPLASVQRSAMLTGEQPVLLSAKKSEPAEDSMLPNDDFPIRAAPAARKLAKDLGIELATIRGTGPEGRITVQDVQEADNVRRSH